MPQAGAIRAGRAFVELFADDSKLVRGLKRASAKLKTFGEGVRNLGLKLAGLGSAVIAPLAASSKVFAGMGDDLAKMSARTGFSVETLSELGFAADLSGASLEVFEAGVRKMQRTLVDAATGSKSAQDSLALLGLTVAELDQLSPEQQFKLIADRLARIEDPTIKAAAALELFGRSGTQLLPMLTGGAAGIEELQGAARKLGLTISTEDAQAAERFSDTLEIMGKVLKQGAFVVGSALVPVLSQAAQWVTRVAAGAADWIKRNKELIVTILKVAVGVVAAGVALVTLGYAITGVARVLAGLSVVVSGVGVALKLLGAVLAFLVSPIGLVITAVAALGTYILHATGAGAKALGWLAERFGTLRDEAVASYQGIADALAAGDITLAAKILWLTLKMEWTRGINFLEQAWLNFRNFFIRIGYDAWHGLLAVAEIVWHALEVGWIETTAFLSKTWTQFTGWVQEAWAWTGRQLVKAWHFVRSQFDSSFDAEAARRAADEYYETKKAEIEQETGRKLAEREERRRRQRELATQVHEATLAEIGRENLKKHQQLDSEYRQRLAENEADLAQARKEWQDALAAARRKREAKQAEAPGKLEGPEDLLAKVRKSLSGLGDELQTARERSVSVVGTFSTAAVWGLGAGQALDRTARASEETAKHTRRLAQEAAARRLTFA
ncbi:MAG TPA: hypothetical protein PKK06_05300 [Phycisphaerae bacterium]|nr:hypothetical protein [Phycisphaerae bacterium]HNU44827.1 hypothetical protein [Phycisphaerae bacterium]